MKFGRVPLALAEGHILGHNVAVAERRVLRKGRRLGSAELAELASLGLTEVYTARLDPTDVDEDASAARIARALVDVGHVRARAATGGRVSLEAERAGVFQVNPERLLELNSIAGVTLATLPRGQVVARGEVLATLKIIPFALSEVSVRAAESAARESGLAVCPFVRERVHVLVSGAEGRRGRLLAAYREPLSCRLEALGVHGTGFEYVPLAGDPELALSTALARELDRGTELLILVSETATMDEDDLAPSAIRAAGGQVEVVGAPVFPGNLLLLGYRGAAAILGAPGCVRSRARNVVDRVLPRLLAGERLGKREVAELGLGGLSKEGESSDDGASGSEHGSG